MGVNIRTSQRGAQLLALLGPYLDAAEPVNAEAMREQMGYREQGGVRFYISKLHEAKLIVRIGKGVYVRPGDPRIPQAGDMVQPVERDPAPARRPVVPPKMVAGLTLQRLMAGR